MLFMEVFMTLQITGDAKEIAELIEMLQKQFTKDAKLRNYVCDQSNCQDKISGDLIHWALA